MKRVLLAVSVFFALSVFAGPMMPTPKRVVDPWRQLLDQLEADLKADSPTFVGEMLSISSLKSPEFGLGYSIVFARSGKCARYTYRPDWVTGPDVRYIKSFILLNKEALDACPARPAQ